MTYDLQKESDVKKYLEKLGVEYRFGCYLEKKPEACHLFFGKIKKKASDFASKACELKNMCACANLSQMYAGGDGTEKNEEKSEKFKKMALEMQEEVKKQQLALELQQGLLPN
ncbi:unnamed protein product [Hermetia illucens]|uniref:Uncharacterized protein n=1 Tax=Hermetia illucens TaxID=343691 RepID=A0A7R8UU56_HERIL|nr:unnamed protein product [Hermetia illucens]